MGLLLFAAPANAQVVNEATVTGTPDAGTLSGTLQAEESVTVALPIVAADDSANGINGVAGQNAVVNVLNGDTLAGNPVATDDVSISEIEPALPINGGPVPVLDPATGNVDVPSGTPAGTYTIRYEICEVLNPDNCAQANVVVTIAPTVDVSIIKSNGRNSVMPGETLTYILTISNAGPDPATGVRVTDAPNGSLSCDSSGPLTFGGTATAGPPANSQTVGDLTGSGVTLGTINSGENVTITYSCTVTAP